MSTTSDHRSVSIKRKAHLLSSLPNIDRRRRGDKRDKEEEEKERSIAPVDFLSRRSTDLVQRANTVSKMLFTLIQSLLFIAFGWFIGFSAELECIQCTSPIRRVSETWDHSCLDGTLAPLPCAIPGNETTELFQNCHSALYRLGFRGNAGVYIHRSCTVIEKIRHECDPPASTIDLQKTLDFFCSTSCAGDGCNRHTVDEITSLATTLTDRTHLLFNWTSILLVQVFLFSYSIRSNDV